MATRDDPPRLVEVEQGGAHRVDEPVARRQDAVVQEQPALGRLDRRRTRADLRGLPGPRDRRHDVAMPAPVDEVGALRQEDVPERRVPVVARPAEHQVAVVDPTREQDAVAVERQERVVELGERRGSRACTRSRSSGRGSRCTRSRTSGPRATSPAGRTRAGRRPGSRTRGRPPAGTRSATRPSRQSIPSALRPAWRFISRDRSSTRKTPANPSPNGTTAELKMLFERGNRSRGMIGLRLDRHSTSDEPAGRGSHGIADRRAARTVGLGRTSGGRHGTWLHEGGWLTRRILPATSQRVTSPSVAIHWKST